MNRLAAVPLTLATISLLVVGCSGESPVQQAGGVTAMVAQERSDAGMAAQISGTLTTTDSGCLAVAIEDVTYPLQFPFGTRLSDDGAEVVVPGLSPLHVGDHIEGGGGYIHLTDVPDECIADNEYAEYAIWQSLSG
ncbi:hypothetical protein P0L94_15925 [Microbacter sp. GSS18]|nr:hypothetical protein P0L94_15925 [Microbacter sp. GSS18]